MKKGFTLIELLVVITLIGILSVAVLSTLNPIEQINKARDARKRADAAQLMQALDRYFASNERFPWNNYDDYKSSVDVAFLGTADMVGVGVCGNDDITNGDAINSDPAGCADLDTTPGYLIATQELKAQFGKRDYFKDSVLDGDKLYVYKAAGDPSVSICYIPASKATRDTASVATTALRDLGVAGDPPVPATNVQCDYSQPPTGEDWADVGEACFVCVPEE